jgi:hypothetical protein
MTLRKERSGCRFVAAESDDGKPLIRLELFHDTVLSLGSLAVEFEVLSGTTAELARILVGVMNERIVGVIVTPKWASPRTPFPENGRQGGKFFFDLLQPLPPSFILVFLFLAMLAAAPIVSVSRLDFVDFMPQFSNTLN